MKIGWRMGLDPEQPADQMKFNTMYVMYGSWQKRNLN